MRTESGRSLIEVIGVLAVAGVMSAASIALYGVIRRNQAHTIAAAELEQIVSNTRLLMGMRGTYEGVSVGYLIKSGALKSDSAPIGGNNWSIESSTDGAFFVINLTDLSEGDCAYFATAVPTWASSILVNGYETEPSSHCFSGGSNQVSLIAQ